MAAESGLWFQWCHLTGFEPGTFFGFLEKADFSFFEKNSGRPVFVDGRWEATWTKLLKL